MERKRFFFRGSYLYVYTSGVAPSQDASAHQDFYMTFLGNRGSQPPNRLICHDGILGGGTDPETSSKVKKVSGPSNTLPETNMTSPLKIGAPLESLEIPNLETTIFRGENAVRFRGCNWVNGIDD